MRQIFHRKCLSTSSMGTKNNQEKIWSIFPDICEKVVFLDLQNTDPSIPSHPIPSHPSIQAGAGAWYPVAGVTGLGTDAFLTFFSFFFCLFFFLFFILFSFFFFFFFLFFFLSHFSSFILNICNSFQNTTRNNL